MLPGHCCARIHRRSACNLFHSQNALSLIIHKGIDLPKILEGAFMFTPTGNLCSKDEQDAVTPTAERGCLGPSKARGDSVGSCPSRREPVGVVTPRSRLCAVEVNAEEGAACSMLDGEIVSAQAPSPIFVMMGCAAIMGVVAGGGEAKGDDCAGSIFEYELGTALE